ncbi:MAG TPA: peptidoglycan editing factor PgeF [Thauera sp.]|uniref:peptidoglycan editing factor PgeF n=1 Tax=Thauera sp. TaxID=1905334 RepID=UPI002C6A5765|nr:peptidoglycan editing factor PgeF [Thauera sp.]HRP26455.1 peptidoglycan editing factor PgeF [Thauera sp.]HRP67205.1 peptidoglycan editing factor PgeF [Thauera sp.]
MSRFDTQAFDVVASGLLRPRWALPASVGALITTRAGGCSTGAFASFNLGSHVGDEPDAVARNRARLRAHLPAEPLWLDQVHGCAVADADCATGVPQADAAVAHSAQRVCAVLTADCLPVLLCDDAGTVVGAAHAGWRGLAAGVLEATVARMSVAPSSLRAWLGPAIGPQAFEVGDEVRASFVAADAGASRAFIAGAGAGKWLADIYLLARRRLQAAGVTRIDGGGLCTVASPQQFYSYRRDRVTGRFASLIWLKAR